MLFHCLDVPQFIFPFTCLWTSLIGSDGKESACSTETWVQSLGQEDILEKGMATHSSILAWRIPWSEEPGGLQSMGLQRVRHTYLFKDILLKK